MIEPFDSFRLYQAIKLHFESDNYDAVKYNFKTSAKPQSFFKRKDKYFFAKLGKQLNNQKDLVEYYVSNFTRGINWVGEMLNEDGQRNYREHQKIQQSLTYNFKEDIIKISDECGSLGSALSSANGEHPMVVQMLLQERILLETVVILDKLTGFMTDANKHITETIVFPDVYRKVKKYGAFVYPDVEKVKKIILDNFVE